MPVIKGSIQLQTFCQLFWVVSFHAVYILFHPSKIIKIIRILKGDTFKFESFKAFNYNVIVILTMAEMWEFSATSGKNKQSHRLKTSQLTNEHNSFIGDINESQRYQGKTELKTDIILQRTLFRVSHSLVFDSSHYHKLGSILTRTSGHM